MHSYIYVDDDEVEEDFQSDTSSLGSSSVGSGLKPGRPGASPSITPTTSGILFEVLCNIVYHLSILISF